MRYVYVAPLHVSNMGGYEVKQMADIRQTTPERARSHLSARIQQPAKVQQQQEPRPQPLGNRRSVVAEERRKVSQRVIRQRVLVELRSETDRRHRNLRESDIVEHIDVKV